MTEKNMEIDQLAPEGDDGEWLHLLLAPVHERIRGQPSPLAVMRVRQRVWREISRQATQPVAA
jgi:hypothetical protein